MHHKKKIQREGTSHTMGQGTHTSHLIPYTSYLRYVHIHIHVHVHHTPHTTQYLTLPYLPLPIQKHKTPHDSAIIIFGRNNHITHTNNTNSLGDISIQATLPTYLPTHLICKGDERGVLYKIFYKSGRHQSHSQLSLASTIYRPAPVESGSPSNIPYVDTLRDLSLNLLTYCCLNTLYFCPNRL